MIRRHLILSFKKIKIYNVNVFYIPPCQLSRFFLQSPSPYGNWHNLWATPKYSRHLCRHKVKTSTFDRLTHRKKAATNKQQLIRIKITIRILLSNKNQVSTRLVALWVNDSGARGSGFKSIVQSTAGNLHRFVIH